MTTARELYYSPLCDTSLIAYCNYLATIRRLSDGQFIGESGGVHGSVGISGCDRGGDGVGGCVDIDIRRAIEAEDDSMVGADRGGLVSFVESGVVDCCLCGGGRSGVVVAGMAVGDSGDGGGCVSGGVSSESVKQDDAYPADGLRMGDEVKSEDKRVNCGVGLGRHGRIRRGPNYEKNQAARKRKKMAKVEQGRAERSSNWRVRDEKEKKEKNVENRGFFSECDDVMKKQLRESRAKALVAKNELEAFQAAKKLEAERSVSSEMQLVQEMIKVTRMANQLKNNSKDAKIGGWAETVADSLTKSVADKAPSSVPTLESVGYGDSALRSSDGTAVDVARVADYQRELKEVEEAFENMEVHTDEEYEYAVNRVKEAYSDVAFTSEERIKKDLTHRVVSSLVNDGVNYDSIENVVTIMGL